MKKLLSLALTVVFLCLLITSCGVIDQVTDLINGNTVSAEGAWENATYRRDMEFGDGAKTVEVEVKVGEDSVTFTLHTDKDTLGDALLEHELIDGDQSAYGLYVKFVNGIEADYDKDCSYWAFYKNGEMMMVGVDGAEIADGEHYELVWTK